MDFKKFSKLIMIEQTFFALPFALIGVLFAGGGTVMTWVWVIVALAAARTAGMSFNRVIDAKIDAKNPRTSDRPIPKGDVRPAVVWITACISSYFAYRRFIHAEQSLFLSVFSRSVHAVHLFLF